MKNIICKLSMDDQFLIDDESIEFNISDNETFTYTFWDKVNDIPNFISNEGLDLLYISLFVFGIDRILPRKLANDCWNRKIKAYIPVLEIDKWNQNIELVQELLNFLSGDTWTLEFRKRELTKIELEKKDRILNLNGNKKIYKNICMFSGGLDSFIGAIDLLNSNKEDILFVSHYGGGKGTKEYQDILRQKLNNKYTTTDCDFYSFFAVAKDGIEDTTRTRSLMFFAHAISLATSMKENVELFIPENGFISLNIPLTNSRLGTSSTRTTHPYYLYLLQSLLYKLNIRVKIINLYQFMTKGEMIINCKDKEFLIDNMTKTMSCSHPDIGRMKGETVSCHCGYCLPCTIRRAAIKKGNIVDNTLYRDYNYDSGKTAKMSLNSYKLGISKFNPKFSFLMIQKSGPIKYRINDFSDLYKRGILELKEFLESLNG
ncbi:Qat anti-phage system QueC-like protein QatC [Intestinibacter bartlettii]|uniref:Qat anti-phage system QueC-like protein QatC n=1 Tax=Intestinibacter bartlettii TaxID=261299 RepID=UPI00248AF1C5|nr:Qat anti-phage system QueC-like protein QatC [Intestinibacter bartlettii]